MKYFQLISIFTVLWMHSTIALTIQQCKDNQECVEIRACKDAKKYVHANGSTALQSVRPQLCRLAHCDSIGICCDSVSHYTECSQLPHALLPTTRNMCGRVTDRLIFKTYAWLDEYNWMALLRTDNGSFSCTGSLITPGYVLTAARCETPAIVSVRLGENDLSRDIDCDDMGAVESWCADPPVDIDVDQFIKHPLYDATKRTNDIALVRLATTIKYNDFKVPVCLPLEKLEKIPQTAVVSGWGLSRMGRKHDVLKLGYVSVIPASECMSALGDSHNVSMQGEGQFCANGERAEDNLVGDTGGPLQFRKQNMMLYGIMSYRTNVTGYAVYTNVSHYIDWIRESLK